MPVHLNKKLEIRLKNLYQAVWWWGNAGKEYIWRKEKRLEKAKRKERE